MLPPVLCCPAFPAGASGKLPAVLLIHGSTPADLDFTVMGEGGQPLSSIFRDISGALGARGIAVLRYNKHYVSGPGQVDYQKFYGQADLNTFLKDAETALNAMKRDPRVDPRRIFVYGWSEGSSVAAQLVRDHPEVRGLILQGMNDANTPEPYLMTLQQAIVQARGRATIKRYAGLGHTLGPASSMVDDNFRPIAPAPLSDMAEWILRH